ncbi:MAG: hypothetical protein QM541_06635 [Flavobacterium sp.]|nr:hypothetical protein [Flavobacterium sp.]
MTTAKQVDVINVGLLLLSLLIAFYIPFQLFLFSYAVLGPLHYLTEIRWLNSKHFFVTDKRWIMVLLIATIIIVVPSIIKLPLFSFVYNVPWVNLIAKFMSRYYAVIMLGCLIFSMVLVLFKKASYYFLWLLIGIAISMLVLKFVPFAYVLFGVFLPTIIHVYLFTLLFMIYGTLNAKTGWGIAAIVTLIVAPFVIMFWPIDSTNYTLHNSTRAIFIESGFNRLANYLGKIFSANGAVLKLPDVSVIGIKVQVFIAFCYTYHYLNWFSKTSIIGWGKQMKTMHLVGICTIWLLAILLYWYNYILGFKVLAFLSLLHVLLEFPLNVTSIKAIAVKLLPK